jgi:hypothetical protein
MAQFKIEKGSGTHTWKAVGTNPSTGRSMTISGGQAGVKVGTKNKDSEKTFDARHDATGMTPKKYINKLRWDDKAAFGSTINIPDELFGKTATKKAAVKKQTATKKAAKKTTAKTAAAKKATAKKTPAKKTASKKAAAKKSS